MALISKALSMIKWRLALSMVLALPIALLSAQSAAVGIFADRLPAQALALDATNPIALMKQVDGDLGVSGLNAKPKSNWRSDAITSLRGRPMNPAALRILGFVAAAEGRQSQAREMLILSDRISRRDGLTQLWLVQDAAQRDDARSALAHMDVALSAYDSLSPVIFPILLKVIEDPRYAKEFAKFVRRDRPWLRGFLTFANTNNPNPEVLADVVSFAGGLPPGADYRVQERDILWSLANARKLDRAAKLLVQLRRTTPKTLADGRFTDATTDPMLGPFAWSPSMNADVSSAFERGGFLRATTAPGKTGMILQRYFALPPGGYLITAKARSDVEDSAAKLVVTVECTTTTYTLAYEADVTISSKPESVGGSFVIPANCPLQLVRFTARSADSQIDGALTLSDINLKRQN